MDLKPLPFRSSLDQYQKQAEELLEAYKAGNPEAIRFIKERHPRFMDAKIPWLPKNVPDSEVQSAALDLADAQLTVARWYDFQGWPALAEYAETLESLLRPNR
jgi:hypothetical protein